MQEFEKNNGPRTICFLDPKSASAIEIGGQKGDQTMESPKSCVPLFLSRRMLVRTILARENGGTHDSGPNSSSIVRTTIFVEPEFAKPLFLSSRSLRNPYICRAGVCETTILVEPEYAKPQFLSSRNRAYHYFCRAGIVRTTIFVDPECCIP